jgi:hypothetical protein
VHYRSQQEFQVHRPEELLRLAPQPVARHPLALVAGNLEHFAMELDSVSLLVGRGNLPHPGLEVGDGGVGQADRLGDWVDWMGRVAAVFIGFLLSSTIRKEPSNYGPPSSSPMLGPVSEGPA